MSFFDDVARNIGNFFGANQKKAAPRPRQTIQAPSNTLRGAATAGVTLPQFDNSAALAAQAEEERKRREAEEAARRAEEQRRAEEARKAEVARLAKQAIEETNRDLGDRYAEVGGNELKAMASEVAKGGDADLQAIKRYREQIKSRKQQQTAQAAAMPTSASLEARDQDLLKSYNNPTGPKNLAKSRQVFGAILADPNHPDHAVAQRIAPFIKKEEDFAASEFLLNRVQNTVEDTGKFAAQLAMVPVDAVRNLVKAPIRATNEVAGIIQQKDVELEIKDPILQALLGGKEIGGTTAYGKELTESVNIKDAPTWVQALVGGAMTVADATPLGLTKQAVRDTVFGTKGRVSEIANQTGAAEQEIAETAKKIAAGEPLTAREIEIAKAADEATQPGINQVVPEEVVPEDSPFAPLEEPNLNLVEEPSLAPVVDEPQITPNAMNALAAGGKPAAYNILRSSGYKYDAAIEDQIATELAQAKSPLEVKAVLEKYRIKSETPQEALQRVNQQEAELQAAQAQQLAEAPQDVAPPVETPAPETTTPRMENSADIAQNNPVPYKDVSVDALPERPLGETNLDPVTGVTPTEKIELERIANANHLTNEQKAKLEKEILDNAKKRIGRTPTGKVFRDKATDTVEKIRSGEILRGKQTYKQYFNDEKGIDGDVLEMTPDEYIEYIVNHPSTPYKSVEEVMQRTERHNVDRYAESMQAGDEFQMPNLQDQGDYLGQEGIHRAMAAKKLGIEKIPVSAEYPIGKRPNFKSYEAPKPEAPAPKTSPAEPARTPAASTKKVTKASKTDDTPKPINPALKKTEAGNILPVGKGKAADNTQAIQRDLIKEADKLPKKLVDPIRTVENLARKLESSSPRLGKHFEDFRQRASSGMAETVKRSDDNTTLIAKSFKGQNKDQRQMTKYLIEHMSNKRLMKKYQKSNPAEYQAAKELSDWIKAQLPAMNAVLKENGLKEIGKIEDYFPRMVELNTKQNSLSDILDTSLDANVSRGEASVTRGFMKKRENNEDLTEIDPMDALLVYGRQTAQVLNLAPVVQRGKMITRAIESVEEVPEAARKELATLFRQVTNQVAGTGTRPETFAQRAAARIRNITSKSQIAGSVNSIYAQIANPTAVTIRMFADKGLWNGGRDTLSLAANMARTLGKGVDELETIDGMKSDYLVTARGSKNIRRNDASGVYHKAVDAGYRFSNLGDLQSKNAAVRTLYDTNRRNGMDKKAALRKAERDAKDAIGDRTMGERSQFTASNKAFNVLASQYQIEQIANVTSVMDGVLFNPRLSAWKKFVGSMAAVGAAYGANQAVGFASNQQVKPLPDLLGAGIDAYNEVTQDNEERQKNGEKPMTPEEMAGLWLSHTGAAFVSNLPFGRTIMSGVNAGAEKLGEGVGNEKLAEDLGLNPRDTNPFQTLPAIGTVTRLAETGGDVLSGKKTVVDGGIDLASKTLPYGGQTKKTVEGGMTFAQGGSSFSDETKEDGTVEKGDRQFDVDNKLDKPSSFHTLFSMLTSGKYANKGGQEYIKSGFDTKVERELKKGNITPDKVASLTDEQYEEYTKQKRKAFATTLNDKEKKLNTLMGNNTLLDRNLGNGKVTQDEIDDLKAKKNKYMYDQGLIDQIETGFKKEELDSLTPTLRAWVYDKAISGRKGYKEKATSEASAAVISEALADDPWPGIDLTTVKATNELADKYLSFKMDAAKKQGDQAEQFDLRKKFWGQVVRQKYDKDIPGAYVGPEGTSTNARDTYGQNLGNIEKMMTDDGLKIGNTTYQLNKADIDAMLSLDDDLVRAGLISEPKFKDKWRSKYGFRLAPDGEADAEGSYSRKGSSSGGKGRWSAPKSDANPTAYLNKMGTGSKGFAIKQAGGADSAPNPNFAQFRNKGSKSGKSSIKIKL